jgi:protein SCO1
MPGNRAAHPSTLPPGRRAAIVEEMSPQRVLATILLAGCTVTCSRGREYELRGQVLAIDLDRQEITVKHEDIRGSVPGMTRPFRVRDRESLTGHKPGELVRAKLVVTDESAYLTDVERTGEAPLAPAFLRPASYDLLEAGEEVPELTFVDQTGRSHRLSEFRGRAVAVTFIYTRCPLPNFCPLMDRGFARGDKGVPEILHNLRTVVIDPDGRFSTVLGGNEWQPSELIAELRTVTRARG